MHTPCHPIDHAAHPRALTSGLLIPKLKALRHPSKTGRMRAIRGNERCARLVGGGVETPPCPRMQMEKMLKWGKDGSGWTQADNFPFALVTPSKRALCSCNRSPATVHMKPAHLCRTGWRVSCHALFLFLFYTVVPNIKFQLLLWFLSPIKRKSKTWSNFSKIQTDPFGTCIPRGMSEPRFWENLYSQRMRMCSSERDLEWGVC